MGIPSFKSGMMFVGWRRRDWKLVYYQPYQDDDDQADDNGLVPSLYFTNADGGEASTMMEGEVLFLPHFALGNCEAETKPERRSIQYRNLKDAHALYSISDPVSYDMAMKKATKPDFRRWCSIMSDIRRHKGPLMKANVKRRRERAARVQELRDKGVPESGIDRELSNSDSDSVSDSDSGYSEDDDVFIQSRHSKRGPMNPPPKSPRGNGGNNNKNNNSQSKKRKRTAQPRQRSVDIQMSGVREESMDHDPSPAERNSNFNSHVRDGTSNSDPFVSPSQASVESNTVRHYRLSGYSPNEINGGRSEDEAIELAIRESQPPEDRTKESVAQTTEDNDGVSVAEDSRDWNSAASVRSRRSESRSASVNH